MTGAHSGYSRLQRQQSDPNRAIVSVTGPTVEQIPAIPLDFAQAIANGPNAYPAYLYRWLRNLGGKKLAPKSFRLQEVAEREGWFAVDD